MQSKRSFSKLGITLLLTAIVLISGMVMLMVRHVPAPTHPIVQQLDAKAFLEQKQ
jgi:hypothetical protein